MEGQKSTNGPSDAELRDRAFYHPPTEEARKRHEAVSQWCFDSMKLIRDLVPLSRGQSLALTAIEEARMWANQGIACNHDKLA